MGLKIVWLLQYKYSILTFSFLQLIQMGQAYNFDDYTVLEAKLLQLVVGLVTQGSGFEE